MQNTPKNLDDINKKLKQNNIVISNAQEILKDEKKGTKEPEPEEEVDVWTNPTLRRLKDTKKFLEEKNTTKKGI